MAENQSYKNYHDVDYDYVDKIPEGWQLLPNYAIFEERIERGHENEELLSVTIGRGVIKQAELDKKDSSTADKSKYLLVRKGDMVYSMRFRQGACGYSNYTGIVSPACTVLKPKKVVQINQRFFHYMFRTGFYKNYVERYAYGIADGQMPLRFFDFKRMYTIVPPIDTQNAIVNYLDNKTAHIEAYIQKKERLIGLLLEEKNAVISRHLSQGKEVGDNAWVETKLKYLTTRIGDGLHATPEYDDTSEYYFINGTNLSSGEIAITKSTRGVPESEYWKHRKELSDRSVLFSINGTIGNVALYRGEKVILGKSAAYINCSKALLPEYLLYVLQSKAVLDFYRLEANGTTIFNLSLQSLKNTPITVPSTIERQKQVIDSLRDALKTRNLAIAKATSEIGSAREFLDSLTLGLVTGQIRCKIPVERVEAV